MLGRGLHVTCGSGGSSTRADSYRDYAQRGDEGGKTTKKTKLGDYDSHDYDNFEPEANDEPEPKKNNDLSHSRARATTTTS